MSSEKLTTSDSDMKAAETSDFELWNEGDFVGESRQTAGAATIEIEKDSKTYNFNSSTFHADDDSNINSTSVDDSSSLIKNNQEKKPIWSFAYYQQFFDVNTNTVVENLKDSLIPLPSRHHSHKYFGGRADLYGPVWISATLVVVLSVFSNLNTVFNHWSVNSTNYVYTAQFEQVSIAGTIVYSYSFLVPTLFYGFIRWKSGGPFDFYVSDYISSYGYSMLIFVPMSMMLLVRNDLFNWFLILVSLMVSGGVLMLRIWNTIQHVPKRITIFIMVMVFVLHLSMLLLIKMYFFSHVHVDDDVAVTTTEAVTTTMITNITNSA